MLLINRDVILFEMKTYMYDPSMTAIHMLNVDVGEILHLMTQYSHMM